MSSVSPLSSCFPSDSPFTRSLQGDEVSKPLVTVQCLVYNHERFLRDCLNGFVMQQTSFPFEVIVHDDASTDHSADIIREYVEKYPHLIKPVYQTENQYSKKDGSLSRALSAAMSPYSLYLAYCEGDDYWTSPSKLQRQVDFMELHPEYTMCFHASMVKWEKEEMPASLYGSVENRDYSLVEIYGTGRFFQTSSVLVSRSIFSSEFYKKILPLRQSCPAGDTILFMTAAFLGKTRGMSEVMSVYRKHEEGVCYHWYRDIRTILIFKKINHIIPKYFGKILRPIANRLTASANREVIMTCVKKGNIGLAAKTFFDFMRETPMRAVCFLLTEPFMYLKRRLHTLKCSPKSE